MRRKEKWTLTLILKISCQSFLSSLYTEPYLCFEYLFANQCCEDRNRGRCYSREPYLLILTVLPLEGWVHISQTSQKVWRKGQSPVANNIDTTLLSIILCITVYYMGMYSMSITFKDFENVTSGISLFTSYYILCSLSNGLVSKESTSSAWDIEYVGSIPGSGRSPREGNGNPLQHSCLKSPMDRGAWWATDHGVSKSWTWLRDWAQSCLRY